MPTLPRIIFMCRRHLLIWYDFFNFIAKQCRTLYERRFESSFNYCLITACKARSYMVGIPNGRYQYSYELSISTRTFILVKPATFLLSSGSMRIFTSTIREFSSWVGS